MQLVAFERQFLRTAAFWLYAKESMALVADSADVNDRVLAQIGELDARAELWRICEEVKAMSRRACQTVAVAERHVDAFSRYLDANGVTYQQLDKEDGFAMFKSADTRLRFLFHSFMKRHR